MLTQDSFKNHVYLLLNSFWSFQGKMVTVDMLSEMELKWKYMYLMLQKP